MPRPRLGAPLLGCFAGGGWVGRAPLPGRGRGVVGSCLWARLGAGSVVGADAAARLLYRDSRAEGWCATTVDDDEDLLGAMTGIGDVIADVTGTENKANVGRYWDSITSERGLAKIPRVSWFW